MSLISVIKRLLPASTKAFLNQARQAKDYYRQYVAWDGKAGPPRFVDFEITLRCNARCKMCPLYGEHTDGGQALLRQAKENRELTTEELQDILRQLARMGTRQIEFTGGEPFLRKDAIGLLAYAKGLGLATRCITNGTTLTEKSAGELVETGIGAVHISVDGPADLHDQIRGMPGMFDKIERTIGWIAKAKRELRSKTPHLGIGCVVSALNQGRIHELVPIAKRWGVTLSLQRLLYTTPQMEAKTAPLLPMGDAKIEDQDLSEITRKVDVDLLHEDLRKSRRLAAKLRQPTTILYGGRKDIYNRFYVDEHTDVHKCFYPWYSSRVDPFGNVYSCSMNVLMGNLREQSFAEIWNGKRYVAFRRALKKHGLLPKCAKCCVLTPDKKLWNMLPNITLPTRRAIPTPAPRPV